MDQIAQIADRRTSVDVVFDYLYQEITTLRLLPGTKISEAEIAKMFGVSRQPVRDAFSRLENMDLLLIRPQKATEVKRFSSRTITSARFVRAAVEAEVLRRAARECTAGDAKLLRRHLDDQRPVVAARDFDSFHKLDYDFHHALCEVGKVGFAFETIQREKAKVDRICVLGQFRENRMDTLLQDHQDIADSVIAHDEDGAVKAGMLHLTRLNSTIASVQEENAEFFDD